MSEGPNDKTYSQPTNRPTRKIAIAGGIGVPLASLTCAFLHAMQWPFTDRLLSYPGFEGALAGTIVVIVGWIVKEKVQ